METSSNSKYTISFGYSLAVCAVFNGLLVIAKEKSKAVSDWMQKMTGHHWLTHVAIIFVAFIVLGFLLAGKRNGEESKISLHRLANIVVTGVLAGVLIVLGFYLIAD
jgi:undecaprenyl pyrophosphate phosphatase UppP